MSRSTALSEPDDWSQLVAEFHRGPARVCLAITGGGISAASQLLTVPGASRTILDVQVPYHSQALQSLLGRAPEQYCSLPTALQMASVACRQAVHLLKEDGSWTDANAANRGFPVGVGCTAALVSDRPKKGAHRAWIAIQTPCETWAAELVLTKGLRSRAAEDELVGRLILSLLFAASKHLPAADDVPAADSPALNAPTADAPVAISPVTQASGTCVRSDDESEETAGVQSAPTTGVNTSIPWPELEQRLTAPSDGPNLPLVETDQLRIQRLAASVPLQQLWAGHRPVVWSQADRLSTISPWPSGPQAILSGSFNPLHHGHREILEIARRRCGPQIAGELSIQNVDKPPLDFLSLRERCRQFEELPVALTAQPKFVDKAMLFPGTVFLIGWDTAVRLLQDRYNGGQPGDTARTLQQIRAQGCRFLVFGRAESSHSSDAAFRTLESCSLPAEFADLFEQVDEAEFRADISSTALRRAGDSTGS